MLTRREMLQASLLAGATLAMPSLSVAAPLQYKSEFISTGFPTLDAALGGGFYRGKQIAFIGGSGSGKSAMLEHLRCVNPKANELGIIQDEDDLRLQKDKFAVKNHLENRNVVIISDQTLHVSTLFQSWVILYFSKLKNQTGNSEIIAYVNHQTNQTPLPIQIRFSIHGLFEVPATNMAVNGNIIYLNPINRSIPCNLE